MVKLERALHTELSTAKRISLLKMLGPAVAGLTARMPKPVVQARQEGTDGTRVKTMEQHLDWLMVMNLKLALDGIGRSGPTHSPASAHFRTWLETNLFRYLGGLIEYTVRWDKPYPSRTWATLHELYLDLESRGDMEFGPGGHWGRSGFDPRVEYKRLLLLGLVGQLVPVADRSSGLFDALPSLAKESRLAQAAGYDGAFGLFVVGIGRDEPPRLSGVIDQGFNGWVFEPAREFIDRISDTSP